MKELVEYIARAIVNHPDDVRISERQEDGLIIVQLEVHPDDMGKVIGRQGRVAEAMRALLKVAAARQDIRAVLEIGER